MDWLLETTPSGGTVVDIGAGTGKLTAAMVERGLTVMAVDPSQDMLSELSRRLPAVQTQVGTGEATGLPAQTADLVTFAQSWHWVEPVAGVSESVRILKTGGNAGWVWNFMDVRVAWVAELADIWHTVAGDVAVDATRHTPQRGERFGPVDTITVDWVQPMQVVDAAALVTTRSYYLDCSEQEQRVMRHRVAEFLRSQFPGGAVLELPYRTHCFRAELAPATVG